MFEIVWFRLTIERILEMSKRRVLIIEDDQDILEMMQVILEEDGYNVMPSRNCWPIREIKLLRPDLILIEIRPADGCGKNTCKILKENPDTKSIPVILVSTRPELQQFALESNANGFLSKPFDISELIVIVRTWAGPSRHP